jgi:uncharacterized protein
MVIVEFMVTEKCNLACSYCYMENKQKFMNTDSVDAFLDTIGDFMKLYNQDKYHISYFGGEPLLNWPIIEYSLPKFKADPRCHSIVIITNGLELNEKRVKYLKEHNVNISLSFDGIWNDEQRPYYNKQPSFEMYLNKKELLHTLTNGCKVMIHPSNFKTMTDNYIFFLEEYGFPQPDFSLVRDDIYTEEDLKVFDIEIKRLADKVIEYNRKGIRSNVGLFHLYTLDMIVGRKLGKRPFGCFAGVHGAGYTPDGKYYPCARFASQEEFLLMDANTKSTHNINVEKLLQPKMSDPREMPECIECNLYKYCNAGCTYSQIQYGKDEDRAKPVASVCSLLKMCYRESMRIMKELKDMPSYTDGLYGSLNNLG